MAFLRSPKSSPRLVDTLYTKSDTKSAEGADHVNAASNFTEAAQLATSDAAVAMAHAKALAQAASILEKAGVDL